MILGLIILSTICVICGEWHDAQMECPRCHKKGHMRLMMLSDGKYAYVCEHCGFILRCN